MDTTDSTCEILNSWKEVAHYLGRGTRTVQRWEQDLGLPVRRPRGKSRSAVMALRQELDAWVESRPQAGLHQGNGEVLGSVFTPSLRVPVCEAILASRGLRSQNRQLRAEISVALHSLVSNIHRIQAARDGGDREATTAA